MRTLVSFSSSAAILQKLKKDNDIKHIGSTNKQLDSANELSASLISFDKFHLHISN